MKKNLKCWGVLYLAFSVIFLPNSGFCKTTAFSPSITGQPLIFHTNTKPVSLFEQKFFEQLGPKNRKKVFNLSKASNSLSEELLGLVDIMFLSIDQSSKEALVANYNEEINTFISEIHDIFSSVKCHSSKRLSKLINQTLLSFTQITNQMLIDIVNDPTNELFQQDYIQMQEQVINYFNAELADIFKDGRKSSLRAETGSALEGLVSSITLYISNLNSLINGNNVGSRSVVLSRQQISQNLNLFIEDTFVLRIDSNH